MKKIWIKLSRHGSTCVPNLLLSITSVPQFATKEKKKKKRPTVAMEPPPRVRAYDPTTDTSVYEDPVDCASLSVFYVRFTVHTLSLSRSVCMRLTLFVSLVCN